MIDDISHEGLRILLRKEGVSVQRLKSWTTSRDPDYAAKKARVEHLYAIADGEALPEEGEPEVIFCMDEFGPPNLKPHPGKQWAERGGKHKDPDREPRRRRRQTTFDGTREAGWWPRRPSIGPATSSGPVSSARLPSSGAPREPLPAACLPMSAHDASGRPHPHSGEVGRWHLGRAAAAARERTCR